MLEETDWDNFKLTLETLDDTTYRIHSNGVCLGILKLNTVDKVYRFTSAEGVELGLDELNLIQTKIRQLNWLILNPRDPFS